MLSFFILAVSSVVLYIIPDRKVTSWTDWRFLGLDKQQWDNLHINLGILFLIMIIWHIYFNWKPIKNYLKKKKELKIFTKEFNIALLLVTLFSAGTITMTMPFSAFINIGNGLKAMSSITTGNPPFGYAEYSLLNDFLILTDIDRIKAIQQLKDRKININSMKDSLKDIAKYNNIRPKDIYLAIKPKAHKFVLPTDIPIGIAKKSLLRISIEYNLDLYNLISYLRENSIEATEEMTFKKLAMKNNLHPSTLYSLLLASHKKFNSKDSK
jgi:ABC-type Fe3+-siderophore transport system permease subunit